MSMLSSCGDGAVAAVGLASQIVMLVFRAICGEDCRVGLWYNVQATDVYTRTPRL